MLLPAWVWTRSRSRCGGGSGGMSMQSTCTCLVPVIISHHEQRPYLTRSTEASAGQMIHLNSFEGQPSFPSEIDDEYLTAQGSFPQPPTHTSYIVGLVACVRLFPVLEQVLVRSRSLRTRNKQARYMTHTEITQEIEWIAGATAEVDGIMDGLPDVLKMGWAVEDSMDEIRLAVMGMQRANMAITAVSIRFALVSLPEYDCYWELWGHPQGCRPIGPSDDG